MVRHVCAYALSTFTNALCLWCPFCVCDAGTKREHMDFGEEDFLFFFCLCNSLFALAFCFLV